MSCDELTKKKSQNIPVQRVINATPERIRERFEKATAAVQPSMCRPELIFNMDETMLDATPNDIQVIVPKDSKPLRIVSNENLGFHITLVFCISADGEHMKPSVILPLKEFPISCLEIASRFYWSGQSSGWMTAEIFKNWATKALIPHVQARRMVLNLPNERALLFLDSHESRRCPDALDALREANIDVFTFLSQISHIDQPLDNGVNRKFKMLMRAKSMSTLGASLDQRRLELLRSAANAHYEAMAPETIMKAWAQTGLYPWSLEQMLSSPYVLPALPLELAQRDTKRKRSKTSISGKCLSHIDITKDLRSQMQEKNKPKRPRGRPPKRPNPFPSSDGLHSDSFDYDE